MCLNRLMTLCRCNTLGWGNAAADVDDFSSESTGVGVVRVGLHVTVDAVVVMMLRGASQYQANRDLVFVLQAYQRPY